MKKKPKSKLKVKVSNKIKDYGQEIDHTDGSHTILINRKLHKKNKESLLDTLAHERYHARHPKATEKETYKHVKRKIKRMNPKSKRKLYAMLPKKYR